MHAMHACMHAGSSHLDKRGDRLSGGDPVGAVELKIDRGLVRGARVERERGLVGVERGSARRKSEGAADERGGGAIRIEAVNRDRGVRSHDDLVANGDLHALDGRTGAGKVDDGGGDADVDGLAVVLVEADREGGDDHIKEVLGGAGCALIQLGRNVTEA